MFRAFRAMIYNTVVGAIHDAFRDTGFLTADATGTPAEQVRERNTNHESKENDDARQTKLDGH
jgi:hypothetical protein